MSTGRSSLIMAAGTVTSRVLGFVRAVLLAATIGVTTDAADAFGVANQLPNNVYAIIAGGVLNAVLVPQIVKARSHHDGGQGYIDRLVTLILVVFASATVLTTVAAPWLVSLYTSGWSADQLALATAFAYWCLPQLFFYGLYSLLGEVLNARSAFGPFMWAPVLNNIVAIGGLVAYVVLFGADPTGERAINGWGADQISLIAATATAGVAAQALILLLFWKRVGLKLGLNFKWRGVGLRPAAKAASWTLGMVLVTQIGGLVQTVVASSTVAARAAEGLAIASIAASSIAWLIFMLPHSIATVSIATASFTKISTHAADGELDHFKRQVGASLRAILAFSFFATAALMVLAYPVSRVFVGEYPATVALGNVLIAFMVGLVPFSFVFMLQRAFYALEDTRTPFIFTTIQTLVFVGAALVISQTVEPRWLVAALALASSLSILVQAIIAYRLLRRKVGAFEGVGLSGATTRMLTAAVLSGAAGAGILVATSSHLAGSFALSSVLGAVTVSAGIGAVMLVVYSIVLAAFRVDEINFVQTELRKFLRGIRRR